ncbi:hypothetical protein B0A55_09438 [Friedmanniomyces simplex]|uniref:Zinc finger PHD-type domain-containing protein n=1 Tax=Friedmanniomyces simplex TaxID=329884 RepID=A0A4U0WPQ0_9PEZI|nr:hypothetical protein B0A55_09438 [Friedmanniomyces simplex]
MASNSVFSTSPGGMLPGAHVRIKQETREEEEDTEYTPMLIPDDGLDDDIHNQEAHREPAAPGDAKPVYIQGDGHVASAGREAQDVPQPTSNQPAPGTLLSLTMRPAQSSSAAAKSQLAWNPRPQMRKPTMPQAYNSVQQMNPSTLLPLDNPSFTTGQVTRVLEPCLSPSPTQCFEQQLINSPFTHHLLCDHIVITATKLPCGILCAVSSYAVGVVHGESILCDVDGCRNKPEFIPYVSFPLFEDLPADFRTGQRAVDPNKRVRDADGEEAPTVCFVDHRWSPYTHILICGHEHYTTVPEACHENCKTRQSADRKPAERAKFACVVKACQELQKKMASVLRPFNNARVKKLRQPSKLGRDKNISPERLAREIGSLRVEGTAKLGYAQAVQEGPPVGYAGPVGRPTKYINNMELAKGQRLDFDNDRPHSFGARGDRNGGFFSVPENAHRQMVENENGGLFEVEANSSNRRALHMEGRFDHEDRSEQVEDEHAGVGDLFVAQTHCVCDSPADSYMVQYVRCDRHFHPSCVGKGRFSIHDYGGDNHHKVMQADAARYHQAETEFMCKECDGRAQLAQAMLGHGAQRALRASTRRAKKTDVDTSGEDHGLDDGTDGVVAQAAPQPLSAWILLKCDTNITVIQSLRQRTDRKVSGLSFEALHTGDLQSVPVAKQTATESAVPEEGDRVYKAPSGYATVRRQPQRRKSAPISSRSSPAKKAAGTRSLDVEMGGVERPKVAGTSPNVRTRGSKKAPADDEAMEMSVSGTSTTRTIIRKQPYASSDLVVGGPSELGGDTKKRTTSMQKLLRCTGWMKNIDPRVERASSTTPPSLRHKSDVLDLRSLYERSSSGGSTDGTTERSSVTGDEDDGEWVTDDEGDDELGSQ